MNVAVDKAGRLVLPQSIRRQLHIKPGSLLEVDVRDEQIVLRPREHIPALKEVQGLLIHDGEPTGDLLNAVNDARNRRDQAIAGSW